MVSEITETGIGILGSEQVQFVMTNEQVSPLFRIFSPEMLQRIHGHLVVHVSALIGTDNAVKQFGRHGG